MAHSYVLTVEGLRFANVDTKPVSSPITRPSLISMIPRTALGSNVGLYPVAARRSGACPGRPGLGYGGSRRYTPSLVFVNVNRLEELRQLVESIRLRRSFSSRGTRTPQTEHSQPINDQTL